MTTLSSSYVHGAYYYYYYTVIWNLKPFLVNNVVVAGAPCGLLALRTFVAINIGLWLPVNHRITYKLCLITWKTLHTTHPPYLSEVLN